MIIIMIKSTFWHPGQAYKRCLSQHMPKSGGTDRTLCRSLLISKKVFSISGQHCRTSGNQELLINANTFKPTQWLAQTLWSFVQSDSVSYMYVTSMWSCGYR